MKSDAWLLLPALILAIGLGMLGDRLIPKTEALGKTTQPSETTDLPALAADGIFGAPAEILNNTEYAAPEAPIGKGLRRGYVLLGRCNRDGEWVRPTLALPPCNASWTFPVRAVVTRGGYVRNRVNSGLQVGLLELGDVVAVRELQVLLVLPWEGNLILAAEIDFPAERGFTLVRP